MRGVVGARWGHRLKRLVRGQERRTTRSVMATCCECGVVGVAEWELKNSSGTKLQASVGSVVDFKGDAIVNAANTGCLQGGGVDGAICKAGGAKLAEARAALPVARPGVRCEVGDAKRTVGGDLRARYCIHAVGPDYNEYADPGDADKLLASAYAAALERASELELETVAFALISAGIYRGSQDLGRVLEIGVRAVANRAYLGLKTVHFVAFSDVERDALVAAATNVLGPPTGLPPVLVDDIQQPDGGVQAAPESADAVPESADASSWWGFSGDAGGDAGGGGDGGGGD